ncbi:MAG TPA: hypothetical protein EYQ31_17760, partial [Candidatus Handelsmanbacteria bacterium]|nr:hypothetical protein [Candidatus Handelsmanbacteria bacterium]
MNEATPPPSRRIVVRLSAMFWLAQMADAASLVLLSGHMSALGFSGTQISFVYATMAIAGIPRGVPPLVWNTVGKSSSLEYVD